MEDNQQHPTALGIETRLQDDTTGALRDELLQRFEQEISGLQHRMNSGVTPHEYERLEALQKAYRAAGAVISETWKQLRDAAA